MELLWQLIKSFWFILILTVGIGQELTGCMDDGYQQWSPNPGSPACNYAQFAIIEGECHYIDCAGNCPTDDGYELIEKTKNITLSNSKIYCYCASELWLLPGQRWAAHIR